MKIPQLLSIFQFYFRFLTIFQWVVTKDLGWQKGVIRCFFFVRLLSDIFRSAWERSSSATYIFFFIFFICICVCLGFKAYQSLQVPRPFGRAVWYSCRMGYQWQIRGRKAPNFGWATFRGASGNLCPLCMALDLAV